MSQKFRTAFFAYPERPADLIGPIQIAFDQLKDDQNLKLKIWPHMDVFGASIPDKIRAEIRNSDVVICDITRPNVNVYYEAGFAIGNGKTLAPVVNVSFAGAAAEINREGFFDTIGYQSYENSEQLAEIIRNLPASNLVELYAKPINFQQPLFFLDTLRKTDFRNMIVTAIDKSKVLFRTFDPLESSRFSTITTIADITASTGIIIPLLAEHIDDAARHNLRAAFLAGISHGLERETLLLQIQPTSDPNPTDYRDLVSGVRDEPEITEAVGDIAKRALLATQTLHASTKPKNKSPLQALSLGASAAENEFRVLENYFVETAEYLRTMRGEVSVVLGRRGSGKTAIFYRVRDSFLNIKNSVVVDLKPDSHQLSHFREELLKIVEVGVYDHTIAAFWYYVALTEILISIKAEHEARSHFDSRALDAANEIDAVFKKYEIAETGDFTGRVNRLGTFVVDEVKRLDRNKERLSAEKVTNIVFRDGMNIIRSLIVKYTKSNSKIVFLFDNIDKGWPATGLNAFDIRLVRLLLEALDKVRRDLHSHDREMMSVVFLRNDIYELLIEDTPDRGKIATTRIDWSDRLKLRQVIYHRLMSSVGSTNDTFETLWARFFTTSIGERESFDYFADHCLMRPRFLINIIENAVANAINRAHAIVTEQDSVDAVRQYSNALIDDFGYEIRDVSGLSAEILYSLIGAAGLLTKVEIVERLRRTGIVEADLEGAFKLLLWYGVLGVVAPDSSARFIYDYEYNMKHLEAAIRSHQDDALFVTNAALRIALNE